jgi:hypothetical protein
MNSQECEQVCRERLGKWLKRLVSENATPAVLVGVSHGAKSGQLVVCATEDGFSNQELAALCRYAAKELEPNLEKDSLAGLMHALEESVKLQSHYAALLNSYDAGKRIGFADAAAWVSRLAELARMGKRS